MSSILPRRNLMVVAVLLLISVVAALITGEAIYYRLIYLWVLLIITSWLWAFFSLRGVRLLRQARSMRHQVGQVFEERYEIINPGALPRPFVTVRDLSALPGSSGSRVVSWINGRQSRTYTAHTWLTRRGMFQLGPTLLESGDLFGLFATQVRLPPAGHLLVTPYLVDIQSFFEPPGSLPGGRALNRRTYDITPYAAGVREYVPGDAQNRIHWPSTARRDRLMVKEFEQDPQADVWIFVDAQRSIQAAQPDSTQSAAAQGDRLWLWGTKERIGAVRLPPTTLDYGVSAAASIALYYIARGRAVGLVSAGQTFTALPAERGERQLSKILDTLAFVQGEGDLPLLGMTTAQAGSLPRGSIVVLVTPSTQPGVTLAADDLALRNLRPILVLVDAASFGGIPGTPHLAQTLRERSYPVVTLENGADLQAALETR